MLGLPGAYGSCGYVTGTVLLLLAAVCSANGLRLLSLCADMVHTTGAGTSNCSSDHEVCYHDDTLMSNVHRDTGWNRSHHGSTCNNSRSIETNRCMDRSNSKDKCKKEYELVQMHALDSDGDNDYNNNNNNNNNDDDDDDRVGYDHHNPTRMDCNDDFSDNEATDKNDHIGLSYTVSKHQSDSKETSSNASFYSVAQASIPTCSMLIDIAVALKCFGVATGYFITVGDCMVDAMEYLLQYVTYDDKGIENHWFLDMVNLLMSRRVWITSGLFITGPISFLPTLDALKFASTLSLMLILALGVVIILYAEKVLDPCSCAILSPTNFSLNGTIENHKSANITSSVPDFGSPYNSSCCAQITMEPITDFRDTVKYISIFVFSFTCHQNIFSVFNEIENRTQHRIDMTILLAISIAFILYLIVAIEGYRTYGGNVQSDILRSYPKSLVVTIMRIAMAMMVCLSYPLQLNPARKCISSIIKALRERNRYTSLTSSQVTSSNAVTIQRFNEFAIYFEHVTVTSIFLTLSYMIAMVVEDLGIILAIVGATGSTMVSYILPGILYIQLSDNAGHSRSKMMKGLAYIQFILGCIIVPTALYFIIKYHVSGG